MTLDNQEDQGLNLLQQDEQGEEEVVLTIESEGGESLDGTEEQEMLKIPKGALVHIYDKLSNLEDAIDQIESRQIEDRHEFNEKISELADNQGELETEVNILNSRADHISEFTDDINDRLESLNDNVSDKQEEVDRRLTLLEENGSSQDEDKTDKVEEVASGSRLARLSRLDDKTIEEEFSVDIHRAIKIYRHFDEWSSPTNAGKRLKSGELKKLLNAKTDDQLAWTQLYRAMEKFENNTEESYELIETKAVGKALIKRV